jgi:hypothetical protein
MNKIEFLRKTKYWHEINETTQECMDIISAYGVKTGSSLWKVNKQSSDIDYIIPLHANLTWNDVLNYHEGVYCHEYKEENEPHYWQEGFKTLYVLWKDQIYNLIFPFNKDQQEAWAYATHRISQLIKENKGFKKNIKNKENRITLFERFKRVYLENIKMRENKQ